MVIGTAVHLWDRGGWGLGFYVWAWFFSITVRCWGYLMGLALLFASGRFAWLDSLLMEPGYAFSVYDLSKLRLRTFALCS